VARENSVIVRSSVATPPVLIAILPGFGSGKDLRARVENWLGAIRIPIAEPSGLLILKQPVVDIGHLFGLPRRFAQHHLPHDVERFAVWVDGAGLLHPSMVLVEWRAKRWIERGRGARKRC
jgi:hypothetical protein